MAAHAFTEINAWVGDGPNDSFLLMDPVRDEPVNPDAPPDFMYDSDELWRGHEYLRKGLGGVVLTVYFSKGDQNAEDLTTRNTRKSFESLVGEAQTVGYAVDGRSDIDEERRIEAASFGWHELGQPLESTGNGYLDKITEAVVEADVITYNAGIEPIPDDSIREGHQKLVVEHTLTSMAEALLEMRKTPDVHPGAVAMREVVYNNLVDWYNTMMIGYRIAQVAAAAREDGNTLQDSLIILPVRKIDVVRKLTESKAPYVGKIFANPLSYDDGVVRDERIMRFGRLD